MLILTVKEFFETIIYFPERSKNGSKKANIILSSISCKTFLAILRQFQKMISEGSQRFPKTFEDFRRHSNSVSYKRLMGRCRLMGSHFHHWIDYNGVAFSRELLEWGRTFLYSWGYDSSSYLGQQTYAPECLSCT